jgi:hypothetical protein
VILIFILFFSTGCNYNGKATIRVTNVGELAVTIIIYIGYDRAITHLEPGEHEVYDFAWPGHEDQEVSYIRYPKGNDTNQLYDKITVSDGDYLELEVEFYPVI